jgi:ribosomal protein L22
MTPDNPQDPPKGKVDETTGKVAEEAAAAKATADAETAAQPEPKPKRTRAKKAEPEAEGQAAAETGVDKDAAEATEEKPRRKRAPKAATRNPEGTKPEGADESAAAGADKATKKAAEKTAGRKRDRRPAPEPGVLVQARARYVRTSARKARLVCDHIRGKDVVEARAILAYTPRAAAKPWLKLLESAVANAEHNHELVGDDLRIAAVHADEGPTLKRYRPRAMGRATRIRKRTSHLTITLTPKES